VAGRRNMLSARRRQRIPVRFQSQRSDCGPACLAMVLAYHGIRADLDQFRREANADPEGVSARAVLETARRHGLSGNAVRAGLQDLGVLPPGTILFWAAGHFVVLERVTKTHVHIVDPATGRRRVPLPAARAAFTGIALRIERR
jgi:ATP-binding cassette, subfamily B, bacterial